MSEYQKCACPHCGQSIEYPAEGMGQTVPCPTCEKPFTLLPDVKIPCKEKLEVALPPAPESTPAQTSAQELETNVADQPKTEWEEWIALNERLKQRRMQSGIPLSEEITFDTWETQKSSSPHSVSTSQNKSREHYQMYCPDCCGSMNVAFAAVGKKQICQHCQLEIVPIFFRQKPQQNKTSKRSPEKQQAGKPASGSRSPARKIPSRPTNFAAPYVVSTNPTANQRWVIVDTETDGLTNPIHVVEIAAQLMQGSEPIGKPFQVYLNHNVPIPTRAFAVHGYSQEFLRVNGLPPVEAHEAFRQYAGESPIVAHSLGFDWNRALEPEWARLGLMPIGRRGFCTVSLSRRVLMAEQSFKLDDLKMRFGLADGPSHKAFADVAVVVRLFREILRPRLEAAGLTTFESWQQFAQLKPVSKCWRQIDPSHELSQPHRNLRPILETREPGSQFAVPSAAPEKRRKRWQYATLIEDAIRQTDAKGNTPLHRAAMTGRISEIPKNLLSIELFLVRNNSFYGDTPIHAAAKSGQLDKIPKEFLTRETMTASDIYGNGRGRTPTPLERAIEYGHADQIPKEFLTPEILAMRGGEIIFRLAECKRLDVVPEIYANSSIWQLRNSLGETPREAFNRVVERESKQREKAAWRPPRVNLPIQHDPSRLLPVFSDESLRAIEVKSSNWQNTYIVNLLEYTCTAPLCLEIHSGVPPRDFGRLCKHIIIALREKNLVSQLPPIARGIAEHGYPQAFGVYPGRFANDLNGNPIYITAPNYDGWLNVFALRRRDGVNYYRYGFNIKTGVWNYSDRLGTICHDRDGSPKLNVDTALLY